MIVTSENKKWKLLQHNSESQIKFQCDLIDQHSQAFDQFRREHEGLIGEMIWNFADFMTQQQITRVVGNKKVQFVKEWVPNSPKHFFTFADITNRYWWYTGKGLSVNYLCCLGRWEGVSSKDNLLNRTLVIKKDNKEVGGGQKSPILRQHGLWTAPRYSEKRQEF